MFAVWAASCSSSSSVSLDCFSWVVTDPCGRGGVREHPRERTRTGGTEPARHPPLEAVLASAGKDGAVRPPWIRRSRRSISPTDRCDDTRRLSIARRLGSAMISKTDSTLLIYPTQHIRVKAY